ncbi:hypothetical protein K439DRAFT_1642007 [Ramaria rubella]|nr:hypothetical protein K439DRAFT_1643125 [Ramaria rubella]KAF8574699.1 hypothetical protein K439DRAFT_1642007 [Ramaria rubella]
MQWPLTLMLQRSLECAKSLTGGTPPAPNPANVLNYRKGSAILKSSCKLERSSASSHIWCYV